MQSFAVRQRTPVFVEHDNLGAGNEDGPVTSDAVVLTGSVLEQEMAPPRTYRKFVTTTRLRLGCDLMSM